MVCTLVPRCAIAGLTASCIWCATRRERPSWSPRDSLWFLFIRSSKNANRWSPVDRPLTRPFRYRHPILMNGQGPYHTDLPKGTRTPPCGARWVTARDRSAGREVFHLILRQTPAAALPTGTVAVSTIERPCDVTGVSYNLVRWRTLLAKTPPDRGRTCRRAPDGPSPRWVPRAA